MDETVTQLETFEMRILSEFEAEKSVHKRTQEKYGSDLYKIGLLENFFIICDKSEPDEEYLRRRMQVIESGEDHMKKAMINWLDHDWWSAVLAFDIRNYDRVLERMEEIYDLRPYKEIDLNKLEIKQYGDNMGVRLNSVMPNNVGEPYVTLQIINWRTLLVDGRNPNNMWEIITTPETGHKLMTEMQKFRTEILSKQE